MIKYANILINSNFVFKIIELKCLDLLHLKEVIINQVKSNFISPGVNDD
jgi:hypothetical protein